MQIFIVPTSVWITVLLIISTTFHATAQFNPSRLDGKWISVYQEKGDGSPIQFEDYKNNYYYIEFNNGIIQDRNIYSFPATNNKERWRNDTLEIGDFTMYVEKVNNDSLILIAGPRLSTLQNKIRYCFTSYINFKAFKDKYLLSNDTFYSEIYFMPELPDHKILELDSLSRELDFPIGIKGTLFINNEQEQISVIYDPFFKAYFSNKECKILKEHLTSLYDDFDLKNHKTYKTVRIDFEINKNFTRHTNRLFFFNLRLDNEIFQKKKTANSAAMAHYDRGINEYHKGNKKRAIEHFKYAVKLDPNFVDALYNVAAISYETGKTKQACKYWKKLSEMNQKLGIELLEKYCKD